MYHRCHMYYWESVLSELILWKRTNLSIHWLKPTFSQRRLYILFMNVLKQEGRATKCYHTGVYKSIKEELSYFKNFKYKEQNY